MLTLDMLLTFSNSVEFTTHIKVILYDSFILSCKNHGQIRNIRMFIIWVPVDCFSNWHNVTNPADDSASTQSPPGGLSWRSPSKHCRKKV